MSKPRFSDVETFTNWGTGARDDNCAMLDPEHNLTWKAVTCKAPNHYICETGTSVSTLSLREQQKTSHMYRAKVLHCFTVGCAKRVEEYMWRCLLQLIFLNATQQTKIDMTSRTTEFATHSSPPNSVTSEPLLAVPRTTAHSSSSRLRKYR